MLLSTHHVLFLVQFDNFVPTSTTGFYWSYTLTQVACSYPPLYCTDTIDQESFAVETILRIRPTTEI